VHHKFFVFSHDGADPYRMYRDGAARVFASYETITDESRLRLKRFPRVAHTAGLDPGLRRVSEARTRQGVGQNTRVWRIHRDRKPPPYAVDQQHPRLLEDRIGAENLSFRTGRGRVRGR